MTDAKRKRVRKVFRKSFFGKRMNNYPNDMEMRKMMQDRVIGSVGTGIERDLNLRIWQNCVGHNGGKFEKFK